MLLKSNDQLKIDVIHKVFKKLLTVKQAQIILKKSERTIFRLLKAYAYDGLIPLIHGNRGRVPSNSKKEERHKAINIVKEYYPFLNRTHALEKLHEEHGIIITKSTFNRWCNEEKLLLKKIKRGNKKARQMRPRAAYKGLMLQMDGSYHHWIYGCPACCLIVLVDDADNEIIGGEFVKEETTIDCMRMIKEVIEERGAFDILYTDKAGVYGGKRSGVGQLDRALNEIGIQIIHANSPEAKGRVERLFSTLQDRLVSELRLEKITNLEEANKYLKTKFIPEIYNRKFQISGNLPSRFNPVSNINLMEVFCIKEYRKVRKDNTVSYNNCYYQLPKYLGNCQNSFMEIRTYLDGKENFYYNGRVIGVDNVQKRIR